MKRYLPIPLLLFALASCAIAQDTVSITSAPSTAANYARWELTFTLANAGTPVTPATANVYLPYNATPHAYEANLFPDELETAGVSADVLLLPPGATDWTKALDNPAFFFEGYSPTLVPTGELDWHDRFYPNQTGTWTYKIQVTDVRGTTTTSPSTFTVTPSASHGFIQASITDPRYLQFSDGTPFLPFGRNDYIQADGSLLQQLSDVQTLVNQSEADNAISLNRVWVEGNGGLGIFDGIDNGGEGREWNGSYSLVPLGAGGSPNGSRFCIDIASGGAYFGAETLVTGSSYHFTGFAKPASFVTGHSYQLTLTANGAYATWTASQTVSGAAWSAISIAIPNTVTYNHAASVTNQNITVTLTDTTTSTNVACYLAGGDVLDDATGEPMTHSDDWNLLCQPDQQSANILDQLLTAAEVTGKTFYDLTCNQCESAAAGEIASTSNANSADAVSIGLAGYPDTNAVGGLSSIPAGFTAATVDTPVLDMYRDSARYEEARWGGSPALDSWDMWNELPTGGAGGYGASDIAAAVTNAAFHAASSDHKTLTTYSYSSGLQNPGAVPGMATADLPDDHYYLEGPSSSGGGVDEGPYLPFDLSNNYETGGNAGCTVNPTGGPSGSGEITETGTQQLSFCAGWALSGAGTWTISYQYETSSNVAGTWGWLAEGTPPAWEDDYPNSEHFHLYPQPGATGNVSLPSGSTLQNSLTSASFAPQTTWLTVSRSFTLPTGTFHFNSPGFLFLPAITAGSVSIANLKITEPDGQVYFAINFNEPLYNVDNDSFTSRLGQSLQGYDGSPQLTGPLMVGETDGYYGGSHFTSLETAPYTFDPTGAAASSGLWGEYLSPGASYIEPWQQYTSYAAGVNAWGDQAALQSVVAHVPLLDGTWRNADATSSAAIQVIGQTSVSDKMALAYVYPTAYNWWDIGSDDTITAQTGTVTFPHLPAGTYTVTRYDPSTGSVSSVETDTAATGGLSINESGMTAAQVVGVKPTGSVLFFVRGN